MSTNAVHANRVNIQKELAERTICRKRLLPFVKRNIPKYQAGWIHKEICEKLEQFERDIIAKKSPRLMLFMPPRHGKSELASIQFPAWFMGRNPDREIIASSYASTLALSFSKKVRALIQEQSFEHVFPDCQLDKDSKSAENWNTTKNGSYLSAGAGGGITGRGADCLIIDDPVKNREEADSSTQREVIGNWYSSTARTRLEPGGGVLLILTRWHNDDLAGRLLYDMQHGGEQWEVIVYPASAVHDEKYRKIGEALHPARYDEEALALIKSSLTARDWSALYQQSPSIESGSILRRDHWNRWDSDTMPEISYIIQSMDTAYSAKEQADFSVISTWGLFYPDGYFDIQLLSSIYDEDDGHRFDGKVGHLILMDVMKKRLSFPDLKKEAYRLHDYWQPDSTIIEAKASGMPLAHEMRQAGIPVNTFSPGKGTDKVTRANSASVLLENGLVWAPVNDWADDLIEECHNFPMGKYDDQVDTTTAAFIRFRKGGLLRLTSDDRSDYVPRRTIDFT